MFSELVRIVCNPRLVAWIGKISSMFDISLTPPPPPPHDFVSELWLCPPGNCPVISLYGLSMLVPSCLEELAVLS